MTTPEAPAQVAKRGIPLWLRALCCRGLAAAGVSIPTPLVAQVEAAAEKIADALPIELPCSVQEAVEKVADVLEDAKEAVSEAGTLAVVAAVPEGLTAIVEETVSEAGTLVAEQAVETVKEAIESIASALPTSEARPASPPPSTSAEAAPASAEASTATGQ